MEEEFSRIIERHLRKEEKILWTGKSDIRKLFTQNDIILVPLSIIFGIAALVVEISSILVMTGSMKVKDLTPGIAGMWTLFGLIFIFFEYYFIVGRFIVKKHNKEKTLYAVTDKRILIFKVGICEEMITKCINEITNISICISKAGIGTITFGQIHPCNKLYDNTGIPTPWSCLDEHVLSFYDIHDAKKVYELVNNLRDKM